MKRSEHPKAVWLIEHLPDVVLFAVTTPIAILGLALHFVL